ncbi:hypothetical protein GF314_06630 [bacterium]|nr:hypothetical protein [bacterium]
MNDRDPDPRLEHDHHPESIRARVDGAGGGHGYLSHGVLGAMDGSITTFTIVAGAVGGGLAGSVVVILGVAKVVADALSMAASNYLSARSEAQQVHRAWNMERRHIEATPEGERDELREIFRRKGLAGTTLEQVVDALSDDRDVWIDTMLKEELHLATRPAEPARAAAATFVAFLAVGFVPLLPFLVGPASPTQAFLLSAVITAMTFVGVGLVRGRALAVSPWRSVIETLSTGTLAAAVAYVIGAWLRQALGIG